MSVPLVDFPRRFLGDGVVLDHLRNGMEYLVSVGKWVLILNLALGWIAMWGNLARLHLSMGDLTAAGLTIGLFIGPLLAVLVWWIRKFVDVGMVDKLSS